MCSVVWRMLQKKQLQPAPAAWVGESLHPQPWGGGPAKAGGEPAQRKKTSRISRDDDKIKAII